MKKSIKKKIIRFFNKYWFLFIIILIHFLLVNNFFSVLEVFNNHPIVTDDYPFHLYRANFSKELILHGASEGFNFFFTEGFNSMYLNWDKLLVILSTFFFFIPTAIIFKIYLYLLFIIIPIITYATARNFKFNEKVCLLSSIFSVIIWNFDNYVHLYMYGGIYSYISGSLIALYSISIIYTTINKKQKNGLLVGLIFALLSVLMHPLVILILIVPYIIMLPMLVKKKLLSKYVVFALIIAGFCIIAVFWRPFITFGTEIIPNFGISMGIVSIIYELLHRPIQTIFFLLGVCGIFYIKNKDKLFFRLLLYTSVYYFLFAYFGSYIPFVDSYRTYRLIVPLSFLLVYPGALISYKYLLFLRNQKNTIFLRITSIFLILTIISIYIGYNFHNRFEIDNKYREIDSNFRKLLDINYNNSRYVNAVPMDLLLSHYKMTTKIPLDTQNLIDWLKYNTNSSARILIEDSGSESRHQYGGHIISLFPKLTGRLFFNRPGTYIDEKESISVASFWNKKILNKDLDSYDKNALIKLFNDYNIKWIVTFSDTAYDKFSAYPDIIKRLGQIGKFTVFETNINTSFFIEGNGSIELGLSSIEVFNASKGTIILKYPLSDFCYSEPHLKMESIDRFDYWHGFIKIKNNTFNHFRIGCMKK